MTQSDVFAFGLILFEMVTGQKAIAGKTILEALGQIHTVEPESLAAQVPEPFAQVLRQALLANPVKRTIKMQEIATLLGLG